MLHKTMGISQQELLEPRTATPNCWLFAVVQKTFYPTDQLKTNIRKQTRTSGYAIRNEKPRNAILMNQKTNSKKVALEDTNLEAVFRISCILGSSASGSLVQSDSSYKPAASISLSCLSSSFNRSSISGSKKSNKLWPSSISGIMSFASCGCFSCQCSRRFRMKPSSPASNSRSRRVRGLLCWESKATAWVLLSTLERRFAKTSGGMIGGRKGALRTVTQEQRGHMELTALVYRQNSNFIRNMTSYSSTAYGQQYNTSHPDN